MAFRAPAPALSTLTDVNLTVPVDGQALIFNAATQKWIDSTLAFGGGLPSFNYIPSTYGWLGWSADPMVATGGLSAAGGLQGSMLVTRFAVEATGTVASIKLVCTALDAIADELYCALYNSAKVRIGRTGNFAASMTTAGNKTIPLLVGAPVTKGELLWVAFLTPAAAVSNANIGVYAFALEFFNIGLDTTSFRVGFDNNGGALYLTDPANLGTIQVGPAPAYWAVGLSP